MKEYRVTLAGDREGVMTYFKADSAKALRKMMKRDYPNLEIGSIQFLRYA